MSYNLPMRKLVSQADASMIARPDVPRSKFVGSWTRKTTFDAGYLVPFMVDEILPGDHMSYDVSAYVRIATPLFPMFDEQRVDTFFFYVPSRILWTNWVRMLGEQPTPSSSIDFTTPYIQSPAGGFAANSLYDHMGIPVIGQTAVGEVMRINALPIRAYAAIYRAWFRDENLVNAGSNQTGDGPDNYADYIVYRRGKSHDYFTSCLPWPQKFTAPGVPISGQAPVSGLGIQAGGAWLTAGPFSVVQTPPLGTVNYAPAAGFTQVAGNQLYMQGHADGAPRVFAELSQGTASVAINAFRDALAIQSLLERDARGGTRYVEILLSHFGVTAPDYRLQRPEYIGGGQSRLSITPIAQTAPTAGVPLGALGGAGTAVGQHRASYAAQEHGYVIGIVNVRSELSYSQGLHKMWSRSGRYDYYWPAFANLGEQAVYNREIYATGLFANDAGIFGYQERYHEYRTRYSEVTGMFRPTTTGNIAQWHLSQTFVGAPLLGATFINETPPMTRVLAAGASADNQQYLADFLIRRTAVRPLPAYGTPAALTRF